MPGALYLPMRSRGAQHHPVPRGRTSTPAALRRAIHVFNLDPAAEEFSYPLDGDIRELITVDDVQEELKLGPNGGLVYAMEFFEENMEDWLGEPAARSSPPPPTHTHTRDDAGPGASAPTDPGASAPTGPPAATRSPPDSRLQGTSLRGLGRTTT